VQQKEGDPLPPPAAYGMAVRNAEAKLRCTHLRGKILPPVSIALLPRRVGLVGGLRPGFPSSIRVAPA